MKHNLFGVMLILSYCGIFVKSLSPSLFCNVDRNFYGFRYEQQIPGENYAEISKTEIGFTKISIRRRLSYRTPTLPLKVQKKVFWTMGRRKVESMGKMDFGL